MPHIHVFQCPSCGASLSYEEGPELTVTCQFCGSNVIVPEELRPSPAPADMPTSLPSTFAPSLDLGQISPDKLIALKQLAKSGRKIEAIQLYRQMFGAGLKEAKDAVEKMEAGEPVVVTSVSMTSTSASADQAARMAEVVQLLNAGKKIQAIKVYRQTFGVGLKEAKDAVDALESGLGRAIPQTQIKSGGCASTVLGILLAAGIAAFVLAMVFGAPFRLSGSYQQAMEAARTHPAVVEALGAPVEASWWPIGGELSCGLSSCSANYEIPIHGSLSKGTVHVTSDSKGAGFLKEGTWILDATVHLDDGSTVRLTAPMPTPSPALMPSATPALVPTLAPVQPVQPTTRIPSAAAAMTATAEAQAVTRSILATQTPWRTLWAESFADNRRGWPTGVTQDEFILVTSVITNGKYLCTVNPKQGNSYWNLIPASSKSLTDFAAEADVRFVRGNDNGAYAYGLVFRHVKDDYGFFGLQNNGKFRLLVVYHTGIYQDITQSAPAIRTQPGQTDRIAVRAIGSQFIFLINDQIVWQLKEDMAPGEIGLGVDVRTKQGESQIEFSNFQVHAP